MKRFLLNCEKEDKGNSRASVFSPTIPVQGSHDATVGQKCATTHRCKFQYFAANRTRIFGQNSLQNLIPRVYALILYRIFHVRRNWMRTLMRCCMKLAFTLLIFVLVQVHLCDAQLQAIMGTKKNCSNEGELVVIPGITDNPCISCFCMNGFVRCVRKRCPKLHCHVHMRRRNQCCSVCQDCVVGNSTYQPSDRWYQAGQSPCSVFNCNNGIITRSQLHCLASCENPLPPPTGSCCPSCSGCSLGDTEFRDGEQFPHTSQPCVNCVCKGGNVTCAKKVCPVVACGRGRTRVGDDGCCLECVGHRRVFNLGEGDCWFQRNILHDLEEVSVDICTSCACKNGTVLCDRTTCPVTMNCPKSEWIHSSMRCCPMCPEDLLQNCTEPNGKIHKHGDIWMEADDPCQKYECHNGTITCVEVQCPLVPTPCKRGQILDSIPGRCCKACVQESGICAVFGDPHYRSFDGTPFNFQGDCKYMLAKDCLERNFTVVVQNDGKKSRAFSWTKTVFLRLFPTDDFSEMEISLHQRLIAKLDGRKMSLPHISPHVTVGIEQGYIRVRTTTGVSLKWDGDSYLEVGASPVFRGSLCGLCGNFNGFSRDDFIGGDGLFKRDKIGFAESWRFGNDVNDCTRPDYNIKANEPCSRSLSAKIDARRKCSIFKSTAFYPCYNSVDPTEYYKSCLTDTCVCPRNRKCSCESIRAYTAACARRGVKITWDKKLYCKRTCRHGKVYSSCGPACKVTCKNYKDKRRNKRCAKRPCVAGCHCPAGYVVRKNRCVKVTSCSRLRPTSPRPDNPFNGIIVRNAPSRIAPERT